VPSDWSLKLMNGLHRAVLTATAGRLGWQAQAMPVLELTTVGRRTGRAHTVLLTSPWHEGASLIVVASRGGDDREPAWLLNLRAHPDVEVARRGGARQPMRARVATAAERARLWPLITAAHRNYAGYQAKTSREIALVWLETID
jgi:deazaflavin-dependent oxidoreductase (nitroreductase family)